MPLGPRRILGVSWRVLGASRRVLGASMKVLGASSSTRTPASSVCIKHDTTARFWVKTVEGQILNCCKVELNRRARKRVRRFSDDDVY